MAIRTTNTATGNGGYMNKESHGYFIDGVRRLIDEMGVSDKDFAEGICSKENFSKVMNKKAGTSPATRAKMAGKLGREVADIVLVGKNATNGAGVVSVLPSGDSFDPFDSLNAISSLLREEMRKAAYWQSLVDNTSVACCIADDEGVVIYQNNADKNLYEQDFVGEQVCPSCRVIDPEQRPNCDKCALKKGAKIENFIYVNGHLCRVVAVTLPTTEGHQVVSTTIPCDELTAITAERDVCREQLAFVMENARIPMIFGDEYQRIEYISPEFLELFNTTKSEIRTTVDFWALLVEKLVRPAKAVNVARSARLYGAEGECEIEFVTGEIGTMYIKPAISSRSGELIGVMVKFIMNGTTT